jgi:Tfp pilus assembly protein PilV
MSSGSRYSIVPQTQIVNQGFSYVEVLLTLVLIAICLVPVLDTLRTSLLGVTRTESSSIDQYSLQSKMEEVLKEPFTALDAAARDAGSSSTPTSYSDQVPYITTDSRQIVRLVYIWPYDGDNADGDGDPFTDTDAGLLYVKVQIDGTDFSLETLTHS